jgi:hypothetical protein
MKIKNWKEFQHFKDRCPPWIKLHRSTLDQRDIMTLSDRNFRMLMCFWMLASEDKTLEGRLPPIEDIAFRLRREESEIVEAIQQLAGFIDCVDIKTISERYQVVPPETEAEGETEEKKEVENCAISIAQRKERFEEFWNSFNYKKGKGGAQRSWDKIKLTDDLFHQIIEGAKREASNRPALIAKQGTPKMAQGWLTERRWEDEHVESSVMPKKTAQNMAAVEAFVNRSDR